MKCPVCSTELKITDRQGVEIDYCPQCRGVWLDRGELDKLIERSAAADYRSAPVAQPGRAPHYRDHRDDDDDDEDRYKDSHKDRYYSDKEKRKRKSFLGDLFDF